MTYASIGALIACGLLLWPYGLRVRRLLHLLQLEHYENQRLLLWLRRRGELFDVLARAGRRRADITPLVFTARARRLFGAALGVPVLAIVVGAALTLALDADLPLILAVVAVAACAAAAPWLLAAVNRALAPLQRRINRRFERAARHKLTAIAPTVIGITGSYGKTTTKVCIGGVLSQREPTLVTPASFNSFLGVVRTINEHLQSNHRDFVVEMGMYRKGDIAELCELVHPTIGVLTAIGPVHLERLGSIEAIADAKAELALALPSDGHLVTNADDPRCVEIAGRVTVDTVLFGIENDAARVRAESISLADGRTHFELVIDGERTAVSSGLLGRHNVSNLLAAAAVGHLRGLASDEIARGIAAVEPPEHRLQPIPNPRAGIVVIDDAYNSNPAGAEAALAVLREHPAKRRILVTPGMVELGEREEELNHVFGRQAAAVCDQVILVGPTRTETIHSGLVREGFAPEAITVVRDIAEATTVLGRLTRAGDVVLFENDLPDMYAEDAGAPTPPATAASAA